MTLLRLVIVKLLH